jgi:membrane complex biogenesis BtpA family protein
MNKFSKLFDVSAPIIGMIHLQALPGTPKYNHDVNFILDTALKETEIYLKAGIEALAIENMHDIPYLKNEVGHEISTTMTLVAAAVKKSSGLPCGIQVLAAANKSALAIAHAANLDFIRAEGFVFGHLADEGYIDSNAGELLRYRKMIGAENIAVLTDIKKKHSSHAISADVNIVETAKAAEYFLSDGLIVTGASTAQIADIKELEAISYACKIPVLVGSGVTIDNVQDYLPISNGIIVGSHFKKAGYWANELDADRILRFMEVVQKSR